MIENKSIYQKQKPSAPEPVKHVDPKIISKEEAPNLATSSQTKQTENKPMPYLTGTGGKFGNSMTGLANSAMGFAQTAKDMKREKEGQSKAKEQEANE